jgi:signal transduction histidine kinase
MVIQHIGVGLITFNNSGKVELINHAAKRALKIKILNQIQSLNDIGTGFGDYLMNMPVRKKHIYKLAFTNEIVQLLLFATEFRMQNRNLKMIILQNIQSELEEKELDAWQKLIRVLTHEIINSITPISSMAGTVHQLVKDGVTEGAPANPEVIHDVLTALNAIQKRSEGMVLFVEKFRNLTKIPQPNYKTMSISSLFDRIRILMSAKLQNHHIEFTMLVQPENLELTADPNLIEQVIINLINNSIQAFSGTQKGQIELKASVDEVSKVMITVKDNGPGIADDIQEKIFIPFFTTRQDGSGIGLSLSRQIMRAHGGIIKVNSAPGNDTVFTLRF